MFLSETTATTSSLLSKHSLDISKGHLLPTEGGVLILQWEKISNGAGGAVFSMWQERM